MMQSVSEIAAAPMLAPTMSTLAGVASSFWMIADCSGHGASLPMRRTGALTVRAIGRNADWAAKRNAIFLERASETNSARGAVSARPRARAPNKPQPEI